MNRTVSRDSPPRSKICPITPGTGCDTDNFQPFEGPIGRLSKMAVVIARGGRWSAAEVSDCTEGYQVLPLYAPVGDLSVMCEKRVFAIVRSKNKEMISFADFPYVFIALALIALLWVVLSIQK